MLQVLVDLKEVFDLIQKVICHLAEPIQVIPMWVRDRDTENFVIPYALILHTKDTDGSDLDHAARKGRFMH